MIIKDVFAPVFGEGRDEAALGALETVALFEGAHKAVLLITPLPEPVAVGDGGMTTVLSDIIARMHDEAHAARAQLDKRLANAGAEIRTVETWAHLAAETAITHARHADLSVIALSKRGQSGEARREVLEGMVMESGRPVLAIPADCKAPARFARVFIAWDGSGKAARAVGDAAPFLAGADEVIIGTVDAKPGAGGVGAAPGADIAAHLARHGCKIDVRNYDGLGRGAGKALIEGAFEAGADLIVMGAYRHARLQQALFGGVTRTILDESKLPLLISH